MTVAKSQERGIVVSTSRRACWKSDKWILKAIGLVSYRQPGQKFYQITPVEAQDLCLDAYTDPKMLERTQAFLTKCWNIVLPKNDTQVMTVKREPAEAHGTKTEKHSIYSKGIDGLSILWTGNYTLKEDQSLERVSFRDPGLYKKHILCTPSQFSTPHGIVRNEKKVPFFLPGHKVEVTCKHGYEVRNLNDTTSQIVVCSKDAKPRPCSRMFQGRNSPEELDRNKEKLFYLFLVLAIVTSTIAVIQGVALLNLKNGCHHGQSKSKDGDVVETSETTAPSS